jgi:GTP cyclohydrolase II
VLVRVHEECLTGDILGSLRCAAHYDERAVRRRQVRPGDGTTCGSTRRFLESV